MWDSFDRDCCMLLRNFFFAQGQGITFDSDSLLSGAEYSDISKVMRGPFGVCLPAQRLSLYCAFLNRYVAAGATKPRYRSVRRVWQKFEWGCERAQRYVS